MISFSCNAELFAIGSCAQAMEVRIRIKTNELIFMMKILCKNKKASRGAKLFCDYVAILTWI
jgi:hypothetical protein